MTGTEKTNKLVLTALMVCLVLLATYIIKIPSPFTQGYVHLGDTMIFLSVLLLGKKAGQRRQVLARLLLTFSEVTPPMLHGRF